MDADSKAAADEARDRGRAALRTARFWLRVLAVVDIGLAALAWLRVSGWGAFAPDLAGAGLAVLASLVACAVAAAAVVARRLSWRLCQVAVLAACALTVAPVFLHGRMKPGGADCGEEIGANDALSDDGALVFRLGVCAPFRSGRYGLLHLTRVKDGRSWDLRLPLERSERDALELSARWGRLTALGRDQYWLVASPAIARPGPNFFLLDVDHPVPRVTPVRRGLELDEGRARWDCAAWPAPAGGAGAVDEICGANGLPPPRRVCLLAELARRCGDDALTAAARCPEWAADLPEARACVARQIEAASPPVAWDAAIGLALEDEDIAGALRLVDRAFDREKRRDPACAAARAAARRLVVGRRGRWLAPWLEGALDLLAHQAPGLGAACAGAGPAGDELRRPPAQVEWEAAWVERRLEQITASCSRTLRMQQAGAFAVLAEDARREAVEWARACAQLTASTSPAP